jgi:hypothetical protein
MKRLDLLFLKLIFLTLFFLFFSCSIVTTDDKTKDPVAAYKLKDTFTVKGNAVIFFEPTKGETELILKNTNSGYEESIADFEFYSNKVIDSLKNSNLITFMTSARYISVETIEGVLVFDRLANNTVSGMILSSPYKKPKVIKMIKTTQDYLNDINNYFL